MAPIMIARPRGSQAMYWPMSIDTKITWNNSATSSLAEGLLMGLEKSVLMGIKLKYNNFSRIGTNNHPVGVHLKSITNSLLLGI